MSEGDSEVKPAVAVNVITIKQDLLSQLEGIISSWKKMKKVVAHILKLKTQLLQKIKQKKAKLTINMKPTGMLLIDVNLLQEARNSIIKLVQAKHFKNEFVKLKQKERSLSNVSALCSLDPFTDCKGVLRVGGWIRRSGLNEDCMHPIILPKKFKVTELIVIWYHLKAAHCGRGITLNEIRDSGFWIINASFITKSILFNCVACQKLIGKMGVQIIADLPKSRFEKAVPFTYCAVDVFGPFKVKVKQSEVKRFGAMFNCLASRAVHIEVSHSMTTDSFIQALRRLIARKGNVRQIRSDNGPNLVGAEQELINAFNEMDHTKIQRRNPPAASHMGGI